MLSKGEEKREKFGQGEIMPWRTHGSGGEGLASLVGLVEGRREALTDESGRDIDKGGGVRGNERLRGGGGVKHGERRGPKRIFNNRRDLLLGAEKRRKGSAGGGNARKGCMVGR